jgi:hypothetical protein
MKVFFATFLIALAGAISAFSQTASASLEGFWEGAVEKDGRRWRVNFDIQKTNGNYRARADFIDADGYEREFSVTESGARSSRTTAAGRSVDCF